jgi:hypothetical protein
VGPRQRTLVTGFKCVDIVGAKRRVKKTAKQLSVGDSEMYEI